MAGDSKTISAGLSMNGSAGGCWHDHAAEGAFEWRECVRNEVGR